MNLFNAKVFFWVLIVFSSSSSFCLYYYLFMFLKEFDCFGQLFCFFQTFILSYLQITYLTKVKFSNIYIASQWGICFFDFCSWIRTLKFSWIISKNLSKISFFFYSYFSKNCYFWKDWCSDFKLWYIFLAIFKANLVFSAMIFVKIRVNFLLFCLFNKAINEGLSNNSYILYDIYVLFWLDLQTKFSINF